MKTHIFSSHSWYLVLSLLAPSAASPALAQDPILLTTVTIHATDPLAREGGLDTGTFTVRRTGPTNFTLAVFYQLTGSASNGVDYEQLGVSVQIPVGALAASFSVKPIDDLAVEGTETVVARITPSPLLCVTCGYTIGEPSVAEISLGDNDLSGTNHPPFVQLNSPQNGDIFIAPATIALRAYAQDDEDGNHLKVEFFEGTNSIGLGTFVPALCPAPYCPFYELPWSNVPAGNYTLTAKATDSAGASSVSGPVHMTVFDGVSIYATDPVATEHPAISTIPPDTATFTVRRSGETNIGIVVYYQISGTASNGVDYRKLTGAVTIPEGAFSAEIVVDPIDDNLVEGPEGVLITLIPPCPPCLFSNPQCDVPQGTNCYPIGVDNRAGAYILDNDTSETNHPPSVQLVFLRDGDVFVAPADIRLIAFAQDAEDHYDLKVEFFEGTSSLGFGTFFPGRCAVCPNYGLVWSNVPAGQYTLTAKATDSGGASSVSEPVHIRVIDGVNIYATDPFAAERPAISTIPPDTATFTVRRSSETNVAIVVSYEIRGTASNGLDYQKLSGQVTIPVGAWSAQIVVDPIDDNLVEGTETVVLTLIPPCPPCLFVEPPCLPAVPIDGSCYPIGPDNSAVAYIRDDEGTSLPPTVRMISPENGQVFTAPADIRLMADAQDPEDYQLQVEFFEGANSLGLANFQDGLCPICPFYWLNWSNVPPGQYTLTAKATDSGGGSSVSEPVHITVVESNLPPVVNIIARDPFASEGAHFWRDYPDANIWAAGIWNTWQVNIGRTNTATFVVRRNGPVDTDLTVHYDIGGTAANGVDYALLSGSVTIPAGKHSARIVVVPLEDSLPEGLETVVLKLKPSPDYTVGFPSHAAAFIIDNDRPRPPCVMLRDRRFHLCLPATDGFCFRIEASTDLRNWVPVCTNIVTDGALHFVDPDAPLLDARFYRVAPEPGLPPDD